jgi:hypothetical protein
MGTSCFCGILAGIQPYYNTADGKCQAAICFENEHKLFSSEFRLFSPYLRDSDESGRISGGYTRTREKR